MINIQYGLLFLSFPSLPLSFLPFFTFPFYLVKQDLKLSHFFKFWGNPGTVITTVSEILQGRVDSIKVRYFFRIHLYYKRHLFTIVIYLQYTRLSIVLFITNEKKPKERYRSVFFIKGVFLCRSKLLLSSDSLQPNWSNIFDLTWFRFIKGG